MVKIWAWGSLGTVAQRNVRQAGPCQRKSFAISKINGNRCGSRALGAGKSAEVEKNVRSAEITRDLQMVRQMSAVAPGLALFQRYDTHQILRKKHLSNAC